MEMACGWKLQKLKEEKNILGWPTPMLRSSTYRTDLEPVSSRKCAFFLFLNNVLAWNLKVFTIMKEELLTLFFDDLFFVVWLTDV